MQDKQKYENKWLTKFGKRPKTCTPLFQPNWSLTNYKTSKITGAITCESTDPQRFASVSYISDKKYALKTAFISEHLL